MLTSKGKQMTSTLTPTPVSPTISPSIMQLIESDLSSGNRVTVKDLASKHGYKVAAMRQALVAIYGNRIQFKRGRTGGIMLVA